MISPREKPWIKWAGPGENWWLSDQRVLYGFKYYQMYRLSERTRIIMPRHGRPHVWAQNISYGDPTSAPFGWHPIPRYVAQAVLKARPVLAEVMEVYPA